MGVNEKEAERRCEATSEAASRNAKVAKEEAPRDAKEAVEELGHGAAERAKIFAELTAAVGHSDFLKGNCNELSNKINLVAK